MSGTEEGYGATGCLVLKKSMGLPGAGGGGLAVLRQGSVAMCGTEEGHRTTGVPVLRKDMPVWRKGVPVLREGSVVQAGGRRGLWRGRPQRRWLSSSRARRGRARPPPLFQFSVLNPVVFALGLGLALCLRMAVTLLKGPELGL
eukprot:1147893-Rhodomonas_salina.1